MRARRPDVAILFIDRRYRGYEVAARIRMRIGAIMRAGHPLAGRREVTLTDCAAYPQALLVLDALLRIDPFNVEAFVQAGKTLVLMEEYEQAEHYFRYALDYDQEHRIANLELGRLYIEAGFPDLAQQQLFILQEVCGSCAEHEALAAEIAAAAP